MDIAFGFTLIELLFIGVWLFVFVAVIFGVYRYRQLPYRVVLGTNSTSGKWVLEFRSDFLFGEWESAFESEDKRLVQQKAREALFAHYRFRDFVNERDGEWIVGNEVQNESVEYKVK